MVHAQDRSLFFGKRISAGSLPVVITILLAAASLAQDVRERHSAGAGEWVELGMVPAQKAASSRFRRLRGKKKEKLKETTFPGRREAEMPPACPQPPHAQGQRADA
jgi:hypothetical protein